MFYKAFLSKFLWRFDVKQDSYETELLWISMGSWMELGVQGEGGNLV